MGIKEKIFGASESVSFKLLVIGFLILIFLPTTIMVQDLVRERSQRQQETVREVSSKWGDKQTITGPVLTVPYRFTNGFTEYAYFLPENLEINGSLILEIRSRGIYDVPVYTTDIVLSGKFSHPNFDNLNVAGAGFVWDEAVVSVDIPDMRGITEQLMLNWDGGDLAMGSDINSQILDSAVSTGVKLDGENPKDYEFSLGLKIRGSEELNFMPVGKSTTVKLDSSWPNPSFDGAFLPLERDVSTEGFTAQWSILDLNRDFPQKWKNSDGFYLSGSAMTNSFGVKLFMPVDVYQKTERTAKYAIAVIALVFFVIFFVEFISKRRIHPLQYLLIGFALIIFYTLLLSLAEQIKFLYAYLISSLAIIVMVTAFSKSVMNSMKLGLLTGLIVTSLYGFIYVLLQLQDFTLLIGSIGLFVILGVVMFASRKIDWYGSSMKS